MINVDKALLERAKVNGQFDLNKVQNSFCQMFNLKSSEVTAENLVRMFDKMYFGAHKRRVPEITEQNKNEIMRDFLVDVEKIFNNDPACRKFVYGDKQGHYHGIKVKEPSAPSLWMKFAHYFFGAYKQEFNELSPEGTARRQEINNSATVTSSQSHANMVDGTSTTKLGINAITNATNKLNDPSTSIEDKRQIANKMALWSYFAEHSPNNNLNDALMFTDMNNPRDMSFVEGIGKSQEVTEFMSTLPGDVFKQSARSQTRTNLVRMIMLADNENLTMEEALSDDPEFDAIKRNAGRELVRIMRERDMRGLLDKLPKAADKINRIAFPRAGASMSEKLGFYYKNAFAMHFAQDILQIISKDGICNDTINAMEQVDKDKLTKAIDICNNFTGYERAIGAFVVKTFSDVDSINNQIPISESIMIAQHETAKFMTDYMGGKHPGDFDKSKLSTMLDNKALMMLPQGGVEYEENGQREYAGKLGGYIVEQAVKGLNIDAKMAVENVCYNLNLEVKNMDSMDLSGKTPFVERYFELDDATVMMANTLFAQKGLPQFINEPSNDFKSNEDLTKSLGNTLEEENLNVPVSEKQSVNELEKNLDIKIDD